MKAPALAAVPTPQAEADVLVEVLREIAATLRRIEARLPERPAPDERLDALLRGIVAAAVPSPWTARLLDELPWTR